MQQANYIARVLVNVIVAHSTDIPRYILESSVRVIKCSPEMKLCRRVRLYLSESREQYQNSRRGNKYLHVVYVKSRN
jgi:hypothetical protein